MYTAIVILHLFAAFVMIGAILLQSGKGAEIGATFGGSSQTIFGGRGATTFLAKFTVACAVIFMVTSLSLAFLSKERSIGTSIAPPAPPAASEPAPPADESAAPGGAQNGMAGMSHDTNEPAQTAPPAALPAPPSSSDAPPVSAK